MKKLFLKLTAITLSVIILITPVSVTALAASEADMRAQVLSVARGEIGYTGTSSYSKYGEWYGYQGGWCTTFALWCFNTAGN
ncbi:MAG: hypothetical protein IKF64_04985, partial [Eubacterium sp.]|nr:hypothetical protein [Eubacterium sp.]